MPQGGDGRSRHCLRTVSGIREIRARRNIWGFSSWLQCPPPHFLSIAKESGSCIPVNTEQVVFHLRGWRGLEDDFVDGRAKERTNQKIDVTALQIIFSVTARSFDGRQDGLHRGFQVLARIAGVTTGFLGGSRPPEHAKGGGSDSWHWLVGLSGLWRAIRLLDVRRAEGWD